ncbi:transposase [Amycolatopsis rubida]
MRNGHCWNRCLPRRVVLDGVLRRWVRAGAWRGIHDALRDRTAAVIDAQTARGAGTVPAASAGCDAGKKTRGRKRHIATHTLGPPPRRRGHRRRHPGSHPLLTELRTRFGAVAHVRADGGCTGHLVAWAKQALVLTVEIVTRTANRKPHFPNALSAAPDSPSTTDDRSSSVPRACSTRTKTSSRSCSRTSKPARGAGRLMCGHSRNPSTAGNRMSHIVHGPRPRGSTGDWPSRIDSGVPHGIYRLASRLNRSGQSDLQKARPPVRRTARRRSQPWRARFAARVTKAARLPAVRGTLPGETSRFSRCRQQRAQSAALPTNEVPDQHPVRR